ncbi:glyoxylase-like metal-dependent hydrolase (beta-lactamase superfamily II) [Duganella sp. 1224]|uniref:MBL fold metallo-hydrolase n=1 Tax=Duganella sp. 1224 TaxID=2587052 RepID=UPI0015CD8316|nr:MBL fold metallo-hydrolase [Duganella sp. 1224]NYE59680.1 glyoxylase-like metal-dependent hydrolase (beta-lactamase superfamily II) [Duganella sp. 1224]
MFTLSRRLLAACLLACAGLVHAAAPFATTQAPGYYRTTVGEFEVTALSDGTHVFPVDTVMTNITQKQALQDLADVDLKLPVQGSINAFLINTGSKLILVDTGAGALYGPCCGKLLTHLRAAGYQPEQVDEVLITHLHKDHAGGILRDGQAVFPNAVLRLSQAEADYWLTPANKAAAPDFLSTFFDAAQAAVAPYQAAGRYQPYKNFGPLEAGIDALRAPGHTPGHAAYLVQSKGQQLLIWGDIVHVAGIQFPHPSATVKYDSSAPDAQATRRQLLQLAAGKHVTVAAAHIAFPGLGHIRLHQGEYQWLPLNYDETPASRD